MGQHMDVFDQFARYSMIEGLAAVSESEGEPTRAEAKYARTSCEHGVPFNRPEPCADCDCEDDFDAGGQAEECTGCMNRFAGELRWAGD